MSKGIKAIIVFMALCMLFTSVSNNVFAKTKPKPPSKTERIENLEERVDVLEILINDLPQDESRPALVVVDSNERTVGEVTHITHSAPAFIVFEFNGNIVPLWVFRDYMRGGHAGPMFDGENCTGNAFFGRSNTDKARDMLPIGGVAQPGNTLYISDLDAPIQKVFIKSTYAIEHKLCHDDDFELEGSPATPVVDLDTLFTPPFKVIKSR